MEEIGLYGDEIQILSLAPGSVITFAEMKTIEWMLCLFLLVI